MQGLGLKTYKNEVAATGDRLVKYASRQDNLSKRSYEVAFH